MAKIAKQLGDQKKKSMIADAIPMLQQLAASRQPVTTDEPAQAPSISPIALKMLNQKLKQGLPPEPVAPPAPAAPVPLAPVSPPMPSFNPTALSMLKAKMKQGLPDATPASPAIASVMQKVAADNPMPPPVEPAAPTPPVISKITKKMGKPVETQQAPEAEQPYTPLTPDQLWGKGLSHEEFASKDAASKTDLKYPDRYEAGIIRDRKLRENTIGAVLGDDVGPDASHAIDLVDQLHHISRADKANSAVHHYTAKMSPAMRSAMRAKLGKGFVNSIWSK
jgi:hypothetical protein